MSRRLIMTLLVRDEADIVEQNICFHLNHGVDFILALDNGSVDGTVEILEKYQALGVLHLSHITKHTYEQSKWVSNLAKRAVTEYKATHLFHCDADEFWMPKLGNLKLHLPKKGEIYEVPLLNYLPNWHEKNFWASERYVVTKPYLRVSRHRYDGSHRYLLNTQNGKILTTAQHTDVGQGNHFILSEGQSWNQINSITIHHFPIRSWKHFERKVINGGSSYQKNPDKSPDIGWQWKAWYNHYNAGLLKNVYRELCVNPNEQPILENEGVITKTHIPQAISQAIIRYQQPTKLQKITQLVSNL